MENEKSTMHEKLSINSEDLDNELSEQASQYAYYGEMYVVAESDYQMAKRKVDETYSAISREIRNSYQKKNKKPTEGAIEEEVITDTRYQYVKNQLIQAQKVRDRTKLYKDAWHSRKDLLIQIAINKRAEMDSLLSSTVRQN